MGDGGQDGARLSYGRRSRLFRGRPDRLLVDEWVPSIALPPPPDTPLEEEEVDDLLDEHGLPTLEAEAEEEVRTGPARLFVGRGLRGVSLTDDGEWDAAEGIIVTEPDDFFVAELRLPTPRDALPFGLASRGDLDAEEEESEMVLDAEEASEPDLAPEEFSVPFSLSLDAPDPLHLGAFGDEEDPEEVSAMDIEPGFEELQAEFEEASVPDLSSDSQTRWFGRRPERQSTSPVRPSLAPKISTEGGDTRVARARTFWSQGRRLPEPESAEIPRFQPREVVGRPSVVQLLLSYRLVVLACLLVAFIMAVIVWSGGG